MSSIYGSKLGVEGVGELIALCAKYGGLAEMLIASNVTVFKALGEAHKAYSESEVTDNDKTRMRDLAIEIANMSELDVTQIVAQEIAAVGGDVGKIAALVGSIPDRQARLAADIDTAKKELAGLQEKPATMGLEAFVSSMTGKAYKSPPKERDPYTGVVVRCPFNGKSPTLFVSVLSEETYTVWQVNGDAKEIVALPDSLDDYKVTSLTGVRRLAWAVAHKGNPDNCHDGIGKREDGVEGGSLAQIVSHDPRAWEKETRRNNTKSPMPVSEKSK